MNNECIRVSEHSLFHDYFESEVADKIFIMGETVSKNIWQTMVHPKARSIVFIEDGHWLSSSNKTERKLGNLSSWETNRFIDKEVAIRIFCEAVNWNSDDEVYFFARQRCVLETKWSIFLAAWDDFVSFENEFSLLMRKNHPNKEAFIFGPDDSVLLIRNEETA